MFRPLSALALLLGFALATPAADPKGKDYGTLFPAIPGLYKTKIDKPEVGKGDPPEVYSQLCTYTCNEPNVTETLTVTIARDPAFKEKYSADALKKEKAPPKEVKVGKKNGYLWDLGDNKKRLVVVLADDKAVIAEQTGTNQDLAKWAAKWKVAVIEKALDTPPAVK
jgi:hypothetical protein